MSRKVFGCYVNIAIIMLLVFVLSKNARADSYDCPRKAPSDLGVGAVDLQEAMVMGYPSRLPRPSSDQPQPIIVPEQEVVSGEVLDRWLIDTSNGYAYWVVCVYNGADKALSFDVSHLKQCEARLTQQGEWLSFSCSGSSVGK